MCQCVIESSPSINIHLPPPTRHHRHGQSEYNAIGRIGGDSGLSTHGVNYARKLADFVEDHVSAAIVCVCVCLCVCVYICGCVFLADEKFGVEILHVFILFLCTFSLSNYGY